VLRSIAARIGSLGDRRVRIDGRTAAGKTTFGHEVAQLLADEGWEFFRASLDDFKRPWADSHLYDRTTGEGYYRNAYDLTAARVLLLEPATPAGSGSMALCSIDPITQVDHSSARVSMPEDGVLIVDGIDRAPSRAQGRMGPQRVGGGESGSLGTAWNQSGCGTRGS
jgi:uridine kinase